MANGRDRDDRKGSSSTKGSPEKGSHRLERVEKEIRDVVGLYLISGFRAPSPGLISLSRVRLSADMKIANLNVTLLLTQPEGETPEAFAKRTVLARKDLIVELNEQARDVQAQLAHKLQMRFTPKVQFHYDTGFESALQIEKILRDMSVGAGRGDDLPKTKFTDDSSGAGDSADDDES